MNFRSLALGVVVVVLTVCASGRGAAVQANNPPKISTATIDNAVKEANRRTGRNVQVKHSGDRVGDGPIPVQQMPGSGSPAFTLVLARTMAFWIIPSQIAAICPSTTGSTTAMEEVLTIIFMHEFSHMTVAEGGLNIPGHQPTGPTTPGSASPPDEGCAGLKQFQKDSANICERIVAIEADAQMDAADKCTRIKALCELLKEFQKQVNTPTRITEARDNCPEVDVSDGQIVNGCCPQCCAVGDCSAQEGNY